ncbi:MAG: DUF5518 domain-containing protein [Methanobacterium sp.]
MVISFVISLIIPIVGPIIGGLIAGYMVGKSYINGIVNGGIPAGIAGLVVIPIYWLLFGNVIITQQIAAGWTAPDASTITIFIAETAVITLIIYLILGAIFGVIGVFIKRWRTST